MHIKRAALKTCLRKLLQSCFGSLKIRQIVRNQPFSQLLHRSLIYNGQICFDSFIWGGIAGTCGRGARWAGLGSTNVVSPTAAVLSCLKIKGTSAPQLYSSSHRSSSRPASSARRGYLTAGQWQSGRRQTGHSNDTLWNPRRFRSTQSGGRRTLSVIPTTYRERSKPWHSRCSRSQSTVVLLGLPAPGRPSRTQRPPASGRLLLLLRAAHGRHSRRRGVPAVPSERGGATPSAGLHCTAPQAAPATPDAEATRGPCGGGGSAPLPGLGAAGGSGWSAAGLGLHGKAASLLRAAARGGDGKLQVLWVRAAQLADGVPVRKVRWSFRNSCGCFGFALCLFRASHALQE